MTNCKPIATPIISCFYLSAFGDDKFVHAQLYWSIVRALQYVCITRLYAHIFGQSLGSSKKKKYFDISKGVPLQVSSSQSQQIRIQWPSLILTGLLILMIKYQQVGFVYFWDRIWFLGVPRSKLQLLDPQLRQNTGVPQVQLLN